MLNNKYITKQEYRCPTENLEHTQTPLFCGPPKIHKIFNYFPPLQPSASGLNSCNGNLSKFFDSFLKPQAQKCKSYIRETKDFLMKLKSIKNFP